MKNIYVHNLDVLLDLRMLFEAQVAATARSTFHEWCSFDSSHSYINTNVIKINLTSKYQPRTEANSTRTWKIHDIAVPNETCCITSSSFSHNLAINNCYKLPSLPPYMSLAKRHLGKVSCLIWENKISCCCQLLLEFVCICKCPTWARRQIHILLPLLSPLSLPARHWQANNSPPILFYYWGGGHPDADREIDWDVWFIKNWMCMCNSLYSK